MVNGGLLNPLPTLLCNILVLLESHQIPLPDMLCYALIYFYVYFSTSLSVFSKYIIYMRDLKSQDSRCLFIVACCCGDTGRTHTHGESPLEHCAVCQAGEHFCEYDIHMSVLGKVWSVEQVPAVDETCVLCCYIIYVSLIIVSIPCGGSLCPASPVVEARRTIGRQPIACTCSRKEAASPRADMATDLLPQLDRPPSMKLGKGCQDPSLL